MPAVKNVGEPCAREPHARIDGGREETRDQSATPREPGRHSPTRPPSPHKKLYSSIYPGGGLAGVGAVGVVVVQVFLEVASECGELGREGAGEAGWSAFLEDGELGALDAAV